MHICSVLCHSEYTNIIWYVFKFPNMPACAHIHWLYMHTSGRHCIWIIEFRECNLMPPLSHGAVLFQFYFQVHNGRPAPASLSWMEVTRVASSGILVDSMVTEPVRYRDSSSQKHSPNTTFWTLRTIKNKTFEMDASPLLNHPHPLILNTRCWLYQFFICFAVPVL